MSRTIELEMDDACEVMYGELVSRLGKDEVERALGDALEELLADAFERRKELSEQISSD